MSTATFRANIRLALIALGYQESKPTCWTKPVGYHLLTFEEERGETGEWTNWFRGCDKDGTMCRWNTKEVTIDKEQPEPTIKKIIQTMQYWEAYAPEYCKGGGVNFTYRALDL
jgi:hypothetical protein